MKNNTEILKEKILKGLELAFKRLVEKKIKDDGEFVFSKDGEIITVKARDLEKIKGKKI